ncbi:unnamed protein product [Plutella xylostella]|uniref:(diamondback moth) hypothetical protein n=1 Tax=Plutella xylostella TaxID=51655 RepID=A0A8S4D0L9_PLUXY|nr:unnamed protein product [Plutella xylostella]
MKWNRYLQHTFFARTGPNEMIKMLQQRHGIAEFPYKIQNKRLYLRSIYLSVKLLIREKVVLDLTNIVHPVEQSNMICSILGHHWIKYNEDCCTYSTQQNAILITKKACFLVLKNNMECNNGLKSSCYTDVETGINQHIDYNANWWTCIFLDVCSKARTWNKMQPK